MGTKGLVGAERPNLQTAACTEKPLQFHLHVAHSVNLLRAYASAEKYVEVINRFPTLGAEKRGALKPGTEFGARSICHCPTSLSFFALLT
ncbi:MAG: hypothetical protein WA632_03125, partial [Gallionella sp.]